MNLVKKQLRISLVTLIVLLAGCGVKGDPLPPLKPAELGRGRPTYKRATQKIKLDEKAGDTVKPLPAVKGQSEDEQ